MFATYTRTLQSLKCSFSADQPTFAPIHCNQETTESTQTGLFSSKMKTYSAPAYFIATMLLEIHFAALVLVSNKLPYWFLFAIKLLTAHASSVFAWLCLMPLKSHIKCSGGSHACLKMPHGCAPHHIRDRLGDESGFLCEHADIHLDKV